MDLEIRHLRAFAAVARHRSLTHAARELLITQPALTRTIQQLETYAEGVLFDRHARGVSLTALGSAFSDQVALALNAFEDATCVLRGRARGLRISFQWALPDPWTGNVVEAFENRTGALVSLLRRDDIIMALLTGDVDVALVRSDSKDPGIAALDLFTETRVAAISTRSPLTRFTTLTWQQLSREPVIINRVSGATNRHDWPTDQGPSKIIECGSYDEWLTLIAAGRGVGSTTSSAANVLTHTGITYLPLIGAPEVRLRLLWPKRLEGNSLVRQFIDVARAERVPA